MSTVAENGFSPKAAVRMTLTLAQALEKAKRYAFPDEARDSGLGIGHHGAVFFTSRDTAVKVFDRHADFETELAVYERLSINGVERLGLFQVPQLVGSNRDLL